MFIIIIGKNAILILKIGKPHSIRPYLLKRTKKIYNNYYKYLFIISYNNYTKRWKRISFVFYIASYGKSIISIVIFFPKSCLLLLDLVGYMNMKY